VLTKHLVGFRSMIAGQGGSHADAEFETVFVERSVGRETVNRKKESDLKGGGGFENFDL
jgi:hypothetical protein